ncbi:MAG: hypothetical protein ABI193_02430 [Minicystis sp.]
MTKPAENLAASLLIAREQSSQSPLGVVESLDDAEENEEGEGAWIDEVTNQVAALWSGKRENVSFEAAMASAASPRRVRRR